MQKRIFEYKKRLEKIEELIDEMLQRSKDGTIIIVEGKRDIIALRKLGIRGRVEAAAQKTQLELSERIANDGNDVIILTDWDRRGDILSLKLTTYLRDLGTEPDLRIRERLRSLVKKEIKDVESLYTHVVKLRNITGDTGKSHPAYHYEL
ncbi:MAG: toprim domain-containing protein [Methanosarcinaceae archaeon]|nr:toprim domain-containing protein [Methanosarcinaceae archaeon]